jgi:hypothetical protein
MGKRIGAILTRKGLHAAKAHQAIGIRTAKQVYIRAVGQQRISAGIAQERLILRARLQAIRTRTTRKPVLIAITADQGVIAGIAGKRLLIAKATDQTVISIAAENSFNACQAIIAICAAAETLGKINRGGAGCANVARPIIRPVSAQQGVMAKAAGQCIGAARTIQPVIAGKTQNAVMAIARENAANAAGWRDGVVATATGYAGH